MGDPARRVARAVCTYLRFAVDHAESAGVLVQIHSGATSLSAPLNHGLVADIEGGLSAGRFAVTTVEAGVLYVLGVTQLALVRIVQEPAQTHAISLAQQMCALILRGLSIPGPDADLIAAQPSDDIVRRGAPAARPGATH